MTTSLQTINHVGRNVTLVLRLVYGWKVRWSQY